MKLEKKIVTLKNVAVCILRSAEETDAQQMIDNLKITASETDFPLRYPVEVDYTLEQEQKILFDYAQSPRSLMLVAEIDSDIAGMCNLSPAGKRSKVMHRCTMGISMAQKFWGLGVGTAMMQTLLDKAKEVGYEQIELEVVSKNERAIALYEKMGFVKTGTLLKALKNKDGSYYDLTLMIREL